MKALRCAALVLLFGLASTASGQAPDPSAVWKALWEPAFDAGKSTHVEPLTLARDRIRITLNSGTIGFTQPVNGQVFGAAFRGHGRVQVEPPDPREAQQLRLFTKQDVLDLEFSEATFSFTDNTFDEVARQVRWREATDPKLAELYISRDRKSTRLNSSHIQKSRMPSSA